MLVSAFRATLEEVLEADLILHIRDIAHEDAEAQLGDVEGILADLGVDPNDGRRVLEVWNKADLLDEEALAAAQNNAKRQAARRGADAQPVIVSAVTGQGLDRLRATIEARLAVGRPVFELALEPGNGEGLHWLYDNAEVMHKSFAADGTAHLRVRVTPERAELVRRRFLQSRRPIDPCAPSVANGLEQDAENLQTFQIASIGRTTQRYSNKATSRAAGAQTQRPKYR